MKYAIPIKKIKKIANPFDMLFLKSNELITLKEVENNISTGKVFVDETMSEKEKLLCKIAYEVINKERNTTICIDLRDSMSNETGWLITHGVEELASAIYNNEKIIEVEVLGDEKVIKSFFGKIVPMNGEDSSNDKVQINKGVFDWKIDEVMLNNSWKNEDYVLKKMSVFAKDVCTYADKDLLLDKDFLRKCVMTNVNIISHLSEDILLSDAFWDILKNPPTNLGITGFINCWEKTFKKIYVDKNDLRHVEIKKKIDSDIFGNEDLAILLTKNPENIKLFFSYIPDKIKMNKNIIDNVFFTGNNDYEKISLSKLLPEEFFKDVKNSYKLLRNEKFYFPTLKTDTYIYDGWINNKEDIILLITNIKSHALKYIFEILPTNLKNDVDILNELMSKNVETYWLFDEEVQNNKYFLDLYIRNGKDVERIDKSILYEINDMELIKSMLINNFKILFDKKCPKEWREDPELIISASNDFYWCRNYFSKIGLRKLEDRPDLLCKLVESNVMNYKHFGPKGKSHLLVATAYVKNTSGKDESLNTQNEIPNFLWLNKEFCLSVMSANSLYVMSANPRWIKSIPEKFFGERDFLLKMCNNLDKKIISKSVFEYIPKQIKLFFDMFEVEVGNYEKFMNSYLTKKDLESNLSNVPNTLTKKQKI
jgi:hypothetical protein